MTTADLERLLEHQQKVLEMVCRATPLDDTLAEIVRALEELLGDARCAVLVEPATSLLDDVATVTAPPPAAAEESGWSRPVRGRDGEVVGTFVVHPSELRRPSARERDLVDRYAELVGVAVEHARLVGDLVAHRVAQREAELAREAAERHCRAKTEFLAAVAVELRTPVQAITGFAELLGSLDLDEPHRREALRRIDHAAQDVLSVLEDVVDISLVEADALPLEPEQVVVGDVVAEATRLLAEGTAHRVVEVCDRTGGTTIVADRRRLRQVLVHLLTDAVQHGQPGGQVSVTAERTDGEARIDVGRLDGPGVPDQFRSRVFQPFRREDPGSGRGQDVEGFGIGLVVSHALASAMGGGLEMAVGAGHGTVMRLTLPAALAEGPDDGSAGGRLAVPPRRDRLGRGVRLVGDEGVDAAGEQVAGGAPTVAEGPGVAAAAVVASAGSGSRRAASRRGRRDPASCASTTRLDGQSPSPPLSRGSTRSRCTPTATAYDATPASPAGVSSRRRRGPRRPAAPAGRRCSRASPRSRPGSNDCTTTGDPAWSSPRRRSAASSASSAESP